MFDCIEVHKVDPQFKWIELTTIDRDNGEVTAVRLVTDEDHKKMAKTFVTRYIARRQTHFTIPDTYLHQIEELCEEASMARVLAQQGAASPDLQDLLPTTVIHFKYPERTSFRRSRAARVKMFTEEAMDALSDRDFERAAQRLDWVHQLDPDNETAFQWKVVCLRSWKKFAECVPVFEAWIAQHGASIEARLGLGELWLYLGQNQRALDQFEEVIAMEANNVMALLGAAQSLNRLGEDPVPILRKSYMLDMTYTLDMIERQLDFRQANTSDLQGATLKEIAARYKIPLVRVLERAERGVLPMHPPGEDGLPRFSRTELDRHYTVLKCVGLEMEPTVPIRTEAMAQPIQPSLFDE